MVKLCFTVCRLAPLSIGGTVRSLVGPAALHPGNDQVALELGKGQHDVQEQAANLRVLDQTHVYNSDLHTSAYPSYDQLICFRLRPRYPIQLCDHDGVTGLDLTA